MSDHTKGPWTIEVDGYGGVRVVATGVGSVAKMDGILSNIGANAHLIASAPELLEALTEALHALMAGGDDFHPIVQSHCRRAIARASGKGV